MLLGISTGALIAIIIVVVIVVILLSLIGWYIGTMNSFRTMKVKIEEGKSGIDVSLEKRYDLIKQQYQAVKGIMDFESKTLSKITEMRTPSRTATMAERAEFDNQLMQAQKAINVTLENYPDLKSSNNMLALQSSVTNAEENLQASRRIFNSNVSAYNSKVVSFPASIVAGMINAKEEDFFELTNEVKRETFEMEF